MPLYTITTQAGALNDQARARLAEELTAFHADYAGVPRTWVHIVFHEYPPGCGFSAGKPSSTAALTLLIRTGRDSGYKREMLKRLWALLQAATEAPDEEIALGIQEVPASQAMEMGKITPDVDGGATTPK
jgi:phenylpyruvate tautomerase PptA (4-oxalocrotonate tautomerase family)